MLGFWGRAFKAAIVKMHQVQTDCHDINLKTESLSKEIEAVTKPTIHKTPKYNIWKKN